MEILVGVITLSGHKVNYKFHSQVEFSDFILKKDFTSIKLMTVGLNIFNDAQSAAAGRRYGS